MKTTTLFQLGGLAVLLSASLAAISNIMYFLSGQPDAPTAPALWLEIFGDMFLVLGLGALFARQSQRGGILGFVGYVSLVLSILYFVGSSAVGLGVAAGVISNEQTMQVPAYSLANSIFPWFWTAGLILFGISVYRAQVFPRYAGVLLILTALIQQLAGPLAFTRPIFAVLAVSSWAWLGWNLYSNTAVQRDEPQTAHQGATATPLG
ncbi:MAG TPA: hypothetical protein VFG81_16385 [Anaerolineales bacterium]|nr:hypothetical protein [Anaerolineales bacterium]